MADAGALSRAPAQGAANRQAHGARQGLGKKGHNKCKVRLGAPCLWRCREESPLWFTGPPVAGPASLWACPPATIATRGNGPRVRTGNQIIDSVRKSGRAQQLTGGIRLCVMLFTVSTRNRPLAAYSASSDLPICHSLSESCDAFLIGLHRLVQTSQHMKIARP